MGALQWTTGSLFELLGAWVVACDDPAASVWLAEASRKLGSHVQPLAEVMPDSELLAEFAVVAPHASEVADAFRSWRLLPTDAGRNHELVFGIARESIAGLADECQRLLDHCASHCDGPLERVVTALRVDLISLGSQDSSTVDGGGGDPAASAPQFIPDVLSGRGIDCH